jgi:hypothetical protein
LLDNKGLSPLQATGFLTLYFEKILKRNSRMNRMHKSKVVLSIAGVLLLVLGALIVNFVRVHASTTSPMSRLADTSHPTPTTSTTYLQRRQFHTEAARQSAILRPAIAPNPVATALPTQPAAAPVQSGSGPIQASPGSDRYYPIGTPADTMKANATNLTKQQVKTLIETQVNKNWGVIQSKLGFSTEAQAYAFFLGLASRESTLDAGLETGSGAGHSYGAIQAAETAYANANPSYTPENDVPEMTQYDFTPQNFYDPGIAVHMGIRHLLHFANQAKAAGYSGTELLRHALIGYNTGWVTNSNQSWLQQYSDEIGAIAGWYLNNGHLYDSQFTWTGSPAVNRSSPWGWYP